MELQVSRKDVEPESLDAFGMRWEEDPDDPSSLIIHGSSTAKQLEDLFQHTEALRTRRSMNRRAPAIIVNLDNQFLTGAHASLCVLAPIITVEKRRGELLVAARFNLETSVLEYSTGHKDGHEVFLHDVCLQYRHNSSDEVLYTSPESDPAMAFSITRNTRMELSPEASLSASQTPSANVSLGLTRSTELSVEYAVSTWSISAHRIANGYQWFWAGTQEQTKLLTPDLTQTVSRHVVVKRRVPVDIFPFKTAAGSPSPSAEHYMQLLREALSRQFTFHFSARVRVKRRLGRLHRLAVFSFNEVKGRFLKPDFQADFWLRPGKGWIDEFLAVGCRPSPVGRLGPEIGADELRAALNPQPAAEVRADQPDDQGNTAESAKPGEKHGKEKDSSEADKDSSEQPKAGPPPGSLEDRVAQACKLPETLQSFRYHFGETVDVESILDEVKTKACFTYSR
ncbi:hypothetical protein MFIFM68171_08547 [Madurella fahalii]|uniref:Uncharacterized protein n=1 Tax=Madurella fahalii TaxID=1157608 RepID=A0ABQ0GKP0_9PEZI